ncbi:MAG: hypothetical protein CMJ55_07990 [Planctomycetaceae bacterium]|nr:hypothetical protein [Planctomycetaceae bacterium]
MLQEIGYLFPWSVAPIQECYWGTHWMSQTIGPGGMTLKSNESDTITHYLIQKEGFAVTIEDGRLWVFADGSESHNSFLEHGEPAKCVVFPAAGPIGMTVKGADADVINAYLRSK